MLKLLQAYVLTMLSETLDDGTDNHDERTQHDGPSSTVFLSKPGRNGDSKYGAELVTGVDKAEQTRFDSIFALVVHSSVTEI